MYKRYDKMRGFNIIPTQALTAPLCNIVLLAAVSHRGKLAPTDTDQVVSFVSVKSTQIAGVSRQESCRQRR